MIPTHGEGYNATVQQKGTEIVKRVESKVRQMEQKLSGGARVFRKAVKSTIRDLDMMFSEPDGETDARKFAEITKEMSDSEAKALEQKLANWRD